VADIFLEVFFPDDSLEESGIEGRDELEEPLKNALRLSGLGDVIGGGGGEDGSNIDIEVHNESDFDKTLTLIRQILQDNNAPTGTVITRYKPVETVYNLYDTGR
jgi:hypothetical protein